MPYFAYNMGGRVQKEDKVYLRNKSIAPYKEYNISFPLTLFYMGSGKDVTTWGGEESSPL